MSESRETSTRPAVVPDEHSRPFFEACARGVLLVKRCAACQAWSAPPVFLCSECGCRRLEWAQASGRGSIHTFGIVHHLSHPGFKGEIPYNVAVVELEEGPRLNTHIVGCPTNDLRVGMTVVAVFQMTEGDVVIPKFRPETTSPRQSD